MILIKLKLSLFYHLSGAAIDTPGGIIGNFTTPGVGAKKVPVLLPVLFLALILFARFHFLYKTYSSALELVFI